jgi:hypothetical protein
LHEPIFDEFTMAYQRRSTKGGEGGRDLSMADRFAGKFGREWLRRAIVVSAKEFLLNLH